MFTVNITWFLVTFIFRVLVVRAEVRSEGCGNRYIVPEWLSPSSTPPPGLLSWRFVARHHGAIVEVREMKDNVTLSLFALPFAKSQADCLSPETIYPKLAESTETYNLIVGKTKSATKSFRRMFTGCYYFELKNSTNHKWIWNGFFVNSTYEYQDTKLGCKNVFKPANGNESMQLRYELSVGLTCLKLRCRLYERSTEDSHTAVDMDNGRIPPSQECNITYVGNGMLPSINCSNPPGQSLTLSPDPVTTDARGRWTTVVTWKNLKEGGAYYYAHLLQFKHTCSMATRELTAWRPAVQVGGIIHGFQNSINTLTDNIDDVEPPTEDAEVPNQR